VKEYTADLHKAPDESAQAIKQEQPDDDMEDTIDSIIEVHDTQVGDEWEMMDGFDKSDISYGLTEPESAEQEADSTKVSLLLTS
jgi:hypothetical protein